MLPQEGAPSQVAALERTLSPGEGMFGGLFPQGLPSVGATREVCALAGYDRKRAFKQHNFRP